MLSGLCFNILTILGATSSRIYSVFANRFPSVGEIVHVTTVFGRSFRLLHYFVDDYCHLNVGIGQNGFKVWLQDLPHFRFCIFLGSVNPYIFCLHRSVLLGERDAVYDATRLYFFFFFFSVFFFFLFPVGTSME